MDVGLIIKWVMVVLMAATTLGKIALIGQARPDYTKGEAVFSVIWNGIWIWLILTFL